MKPLNKLHHLTQHTAPCCHLVCHPVPLHSLPYIFFRNRVPWQKLEWVWLRLAIGDNLKPRKKMLQFPLFMFHLWNQPCLINDKVCLTVYTQFVIRSLLEEVPVIQTVKSAFQCHCHITVFIIILLWIFFFYLGLILVKVKCLEIFSWCSELLKISSKKE